MKIEPKWKPSTREEAEAVLKEIIDCLNGLVVAGPGLNERNMAALQFLRQHFREERARKKLEREQRRVAREAELIRQGRRTVVYAGGMKVTTTKYRNRTVTRLQAGRKAMPPVRRRRGDAVLPGEGK